MRNRTEKTASLAEKELAMQDLEKKVVQRTRSITFVKKLGCDEPRPLGRRNNDDDCLVCVAAECLASWEHNLQSWATQCMR
jgi:hypothetical protein